MPLISYHWIWIGLLSICTDHAKQLSSLAPFDLTNPAVVLEAMPGELEGAEAGNFAEQSLPLTHLSKRDTIALDQYSFLQMDADTLVNAGTVAPFLQKLAELERGERKQINIVHIGDSHIQADWLTGYLRTQLQARFGSGGRGMVFPYTLAETNSPANIRSGSNKSWEYRRSSYRQKHIPIGIAGLSIQTSGTEVWLDLQIRNDTLIPYAFDQVKLFGQSGPEGLVWSIGQFVTNKEIPVAAPPKTYHTVRSGDTLYGLALQYGTRVNRLQQWNNLRGTMIKPGQKLVVGNGYSTAGNYEQATFEAQQEFHWDSGPQQGQPAVVQLDSLTRRLLISGHKTDGSSGQVRIYGMSLENSRQSGLLYHAIGVNGVTFFHYNESPEFWEQLPYLEPDLIIVSLGTNEAAHSSFQAAGFSEQVQAFANHLKQSVVGTPVIFTTPPDALRRRRYDNPSIRLAGDIITETAVRNAYAAWDLQEVMGGPGIIRAWKAQQLTARDYLHFTKAGYALQGELLLRAIMEAYEGS